MVWFSLTSPGEKQAGWRRLEYGPLARYPAPAWGIRVVGWPQKGPVTATTWWSDQEPTIAGRLRRESGDFTNALAIPRTRVPCVVIEGEDQDTVVVESVQHQGREVESRAGEKKQKENCLVVRLSYPKGKPFFALVPNAIGHEHRFFTDAGKYTGVFFGITEEQATNQVSVINLYSVENFKRKAVQARNFVENFDLGVPESDEARPEQVAKPTETP